MLQLDDLQYMKLYKKKFYAPINMKDKKHGAAIILFTPNYDASKDFISNNKFMINRNLTYQSYYIERDLLYTINHESGLLEYKNGIINESTDIILNEDLNEFYINDDFLKLGDKVLFLSEDTKYNTRYKKMLYNKRIRTNASIIKFYKVVKKDNPLIKKTFIRYKQYKRLNLFIDLHYYNSLYLMNANYNNIIRANEMYFEFMKRLILDERLVNAGYNKRTIFIPINGWDKIIPFKKEDILNFRKVINPLSVLYKSLKLKIDNIHVYDGLDFIFYADNGYFKFNTSKINSQTRTRFLSFINKLQNNDIIDDSDTPDNSPSGITTDIVDKLDKNSGIKIYNLTGDNITNNNEKEELKQELVKKINNAAKVSNDEKETIEKLEEDEEVKRIIQDLQVDADDNIKISASRSARIEKNRDEFLNKKIDNKTVKDLIENSNKPTELPETALPIETINDEWKHLKAINFEKEYNLDADIMNILYSLSDKNKEYPITILSVDKQDSSTSEDSIYTYTVKCEDYSGKRFTFRFDIPKFRDNRYMRLRGNEKLFSVEMPLIPISKTDADTVQIVSLYNKIFISTYNTSSGKSNKSTAKLMKALSKYDGRDVDIVLGDNSRICAKYELPIDYIDLASTYTKIVSKSSKYGTITFYFNQDEIRNKIGDKKFNGIPIGLKNNGDIITYSEIYGNVSNQIASIINDSSPKFKELYDKQTTPKKTTYSRASILGTKIPVIVILSHDIGLTRAMELAKIKYYITDKRDNSYIGDVVKLSDGFIYYDENYYSSLLMNGLKECDTEQLSIKELNNKITWVEQLENFGGRIKSDGLTNFKDLMYDPITVEVSKDYKLPTTYHEALIYASNLLVDNKYVKHIDISTNRYRTNEVVAAQLYRVLSDSYKDYALSNKRGRNVALIMKQSAVIDLILAQNTTSDLSVYQPLLEIESKNTISTKGVTGMNTERAYKIDKRGYDDSMVNIIAQATGFADTVGVNRQTTINPNITGGRGYFKPPKEEDINVTNTLSMTEALSPFVVTSDDLFRNDMTFIQTSKHSSPIKFSSPMLITTGADVAMPYLCSDMFAVKAKENGKVTEVTDDYITISYNDGTNDYIRLDEVTMKNSSGGFYVGLQMKTDLKPGNTVKKGSIIAYDNKSFSNNIASNQLAYNIGCLTKTAIMSTEDGIEDAGVCSEWLTEAMSSDIVTMKAISLSPMTNVSYLVSKGTKVTEGDPILQFHNSYDEKDANILLKNLNNEDGTLSEIGVNTIKSKVTGIISEVKIYRTCEIEELSESLKKIVRAKELQINREKKRANNSRTHVQFDSTEKLPMTGKLKNVDGVLIEIYMKYHDKLAVGDKVVVLNANKNTLKKVYSDEDAPYTDFRPNEKIDEISSASSMDGRMVTSIMKVGALNKLMIELHRKVCDMNGVKWKDLHEIEKGINS